MQPFHLYILLDEKTLSTRSIFQKTYYMPERGITTEDLLHHHAYLWSDV
jgi:hypothetical protein